MQNAEQQGNYTTESVGIWLTNHTTGRAFRPVRKRKRSRNRQSRKLPGRFRSDFYAKVGRRISAKKSLAFNRRGRRLLRFHKYTAFHYTLNARELGADDHQAAWLEDAANYDKPALVEAWLRLFDAAFPEQPYKWALHIGDCGRVHAHVVAGQFHSVPNLSRDPRRRKLIENTLFDYVRVFGYLTVKNEPTDEQLVNYQKAANRVGGARRLPRHSGFRGFETPKQAKKASINPVLDGVGRKFHINNSAAKTHPTMTTERLECWLLDNLGSFKVTVSPPPKPKSTCSGGNAVT